jgi:hypothetical protein
MPPQPQSGLTQVLAVSFVGIIACGIYMIAIAPLIDYYIEFAATLPLLDPTMKSCMGTVMWMGHAFYLVVTVLAVCFVLYPIAYTIKRHRYMDVEPVGMADEQTFGG